MFVNVREFLQVIKSKTIRNGRAMRMKSVEYNESNVIWGFISMNEGIF